MGLKIDWKGRQRRGVEERGWGRGRGWRKMEWRKGQNSDGGSRWNTKEEETAQRYEGKVDEGVMRGDKDRARRGSSSVSAGDSRLSSRLSARSPHLSN